MALDTRDSMPVPSPGEARLSAVWEVAADAMAISDPGGVVVAANPAYYELYGLRPDEVLGHDFSIIFPAAVREEAREQYAAVFSAPEIAPQVESTVRRTDGTERIVATRYTFLLDQGRRVAMLSMIRDVTELKRAEAERDALLASASHDLKSPLTTIVGSIQLLERRVSRAESVASETIVPGLTVMRAAAAKMRALVNEFVDTARVQRGQYLDLDLQPVDLTALVEQAVQEVQQAAGRRFTLTLSHRSRPLVGEWDQQRVERVVHNLIGNAVKYSPAGGAIALTLGHEQHGDSAMAVLQVADEGIGIPPADLPHVFEYLRRGSNVVGHFPGSGIGLAGAKQIVEQHGGSLSVSSVEGRGSVFTARLPLLP